MMLQNLPLRVKTHRHRDPAGTSVLPLEADERVQRRGRSKSAKNCLRFIFGNVLFRVAARLHAVDEAMAGSSTYSSSGVVEVGGEMRAQIASIVTGAVD